MFLSANVDVSHFVADAIVTFAVDDDLSVSFVRVYQAPLVTDGDLSRFHSHSQLKRVVCKKCGDGNIPWDIEIWRERAKKMG